jgi:hypothetical protein
VLGLAVVKALAERHGGSAWDASAGRGLEAEVGFRPPLAAPPTAPA